MKRKCIIGLAIVLMLFTAISLVIIGCQRTNHAEIATRIAEDWTSESVAYVSEEMALLIISDIPLVTDAFTSLIEGQITEHVAWSYSQPSKLSDNRYKVIPTAMSTIDVPMIGSYSVSADFLLTVDTEQEKVVNWGIDTNSFEFSSN